MEQKVPDYWVNQIRPVLGTEEERAVSEYMRSGAWLTEFKKTRGFEEMLAEYLGVDHCITFSNCTAALFASMKILGIGRGDEVIVPDYTFIAPALAISWTGAMPVFVDVSPKNLCLDLDLVKQAITWQTKAIMVVGLNGRAPDMRRAKDLCDRHGLWLIEDAAQALGSRQQGQLLGTIGVTGCISFSSIKIITTGVGGILITGNGWIAEKARKLKNLGRPGLGANTHEEIGFNFKFTDLQAVIGIEQFKKLAYRISHKKGTYAMYRDELSAVDDIAFIDTDLGDVVPWLVDILVPNRDSLKTFLASRGIHTRPMYLPIHAQPAYSHVKGDFPNSEHAGNHGLWLPSSSDLDAPTIRRICKEIRSFYA